GGAGIPVFFTKGLLEVAYIPDSANYSTMEKMAETLKNEILEDVLNGIKAHNDVKEEDDDV
ncbi:16815_t:CDS:1, partial [Cetraspora pellucida]